MKYTEFLQEKNLSNNTINVYLKFVKVWIDYLNNQNPSKYIISNLIKEFSRKHSPNSTRLLYYVIRSYLKYENQHELLNEIDDIKLPTTINIKRNIISLNDFEKIKGVIKYNTFFQQRDWIIFTLLFTTGIRAHEINQIRKSNIKDRKIRIVGKGNLEL